MECKITLEIGGESIEVSVDSQLLPSNYVELKEILKRNNQWDLLVNNIKSTLMNRKTIDDTDLQKLIESDHIIPNATIEQLKSRFPEVEFPEDTDQYEISSKKVLFVNKYKTKTGELLYGRVLNPNGEEIFIVDAAHINQLVNYFTFQKQISSSPILSKMDDDYKEQLDAIYKSALKEDSLKQPLEDYVKSKKAKYPELNEEDIRRESLLILFSQNKSPFRSIFYNFNSEELGSYKTLNDLCENILEVSTKKRTYSDRNLEDIIRSINKYSSGFREAYLSKNNVVKLLSNDLKQKFLAKPDLKNKDNSLSYEKLNKQLNKSIKDNKTFLYEIFGKDIVDKYDDKSDGWNILVQEILNKDRTFNFNYSSQSGDKITLKKFASTLESSFGIGFEDLKVYNPPKYYHGKYIQEQKVGNNTYYYVTNDYTTEFLSARKFETLQDAQNYINSEESKIVKYSFKKIHSKSLDKNNNLITDDTNNLYVFSDRYIPDKTIITVLDYDVPDLKISDIDYNMRDFISSNKKELKMKDFKDFVNNKLETYSEDVYYDGDYKLILENINTPEKVFLFISQLNNPVYKEVTKVNEETGETEISKEKFNIASKQEVLDLAEEIGGLEANKKFRYYYVKKNNNNLLTLIRTAPEIIPEYRKDRDYPPRNLLESASKVLAPKLGNAKLKILSDDEIKAELGDKYDFDAKAFIKGDTVYINSDLAGAEDLFHEYVHILMAYLKTNDSTKQQYMKLLKEVWEFEEVDPIRNRIMEGVAYRDYALIDKMEEYFAIKFGNWIKNNSKIGFSNIFNNTILKEGTKLLFDPDNLSKSLKELYGSKLYDVFLNFNSEIGLYLKENKTIADGEFSIFLNCLEKELSGLENRLILEI